MYTVSVILKEQCNEQHHYYPQQLKEFYKKKISGLFSGLEFSINTTFYYSAQTVLRSKLSGKIVMSTLTSHSVMDVNKFNPH